MDRIDSYIQQAFAKFRDVSEIQAQKEEMADHLRDRIADAIGQGKSEKEAFASATAAMSDAMPDLEQTLAEFLRPEFKTGVKPKPHTKEIYINFYRYHRAMMLMCVQVLFTLMLLGVCEVYVDVNNQHWEQWSGILIGMAGWFDLLMGIFIIYSIAAYIINPRKIKQVSMSPWTLMVRFCIGAVLIIILTLIFWYAFLFPDDADQAFQLLVPFLVFYTAFFIIFCCLGWFRQHRYMKEPDVTQDTALAKGGLILAAVFLLIGLAPLLGLVDMHNRAFYHDRPYYEGVRNENNQLQYELDNCSTSLEHAQRQLNAETGPSYYAIMPNASIIADGIPSILQQPPLSIPANYKGSSPLREGMWAHISDPDTHYPLWQVHGTNRDYKIIDAQWQWQGQGNTMSAPSMMGGGMVMPGAGGLSGMGTMSGSSNPMSGMMMGSGMAGIMVGDSQPPERKEHTLTLDGDFPATDLAENVICARQFPFDEYKLGMIQAVAPETVGVGETLPLRLGIGNLDARNAKLLLTLEYDDGLQQDAIPSGATLFLGFIGSREYREYKTAFTVATDAEHRFRLTLRNESGQVIAETDVVVNRSPEVPDEAPAIEDDSLRLKDMFRAMNREFIDRLPEEERDSPQAQQLKANDFFITQIETTIPDLFLVAEDLAQSFREKTYDRDAALAEIQRARNAFDSNGTILSLSTLTMLEKVKNNPDAMSNEELELTRRLTALTLKSMEMEFDK